MNYEAAFRAFEARDYARAVELLEPAVHASGYASDILNHTYTLALHYSGETERLADAAFRVGQRFLTDDPASALDYFQRALYAGLDRDRSRQIGAILEDWSGARSGVSRGGRLHGSPLRIAHVVGSLLPGPVSHYVRGLCHSLSDAGIESRVFTTESFSCWFFNPGPYTAASMVEIGAQVSTGSVEGDFLERADRVASEISSAGCDLALYHADLGEQITAHVAALRPVPLQVNVNHDMEMDANLFDGAVHLFKDAFDETQFRDRPSRWIPPVTGLDSSGVLSGASAARFRSPGRADLGLFETVSATFGDARTTSDDGFLQVLVEILRRSPGHLHLFVGSGDSRRARSYLHARDVLGQVRFLVQPMGGTEYMRLIDLYLGSFPSADVQSILDAMGAGKPAIVRAYPDNARSNRGAVCVGLDEMIASTAADFVERACHVIADAEYRDALGQAAHHRFRQEFTTARLGSEYLDFLEQFLG